MLRITRMVGDDSGEILKLEGKLQGPWVDEAHDAYALSAAQASRTCLDLSGLTFADGEGAALLRELIRSGARPWAVLPLSLSCSNFQQGVDGSDETDSI